MDQKSYETRNIAKKDWIKPADASIAQLDQVKATVYNLGLHDARDLRATKGRTQTAAPHSTFLDLCTEPPLSTISYQKAVWGSNSSIPELIKKIGEAKIISARPFSAKVTSASHAPHKLKVRPQSAKDPLCPTGKKAVPSGVKGKHYEPSERSAKDILPHAGLPGWAGPPAGLYLHITQNQADEELDGDGDTDGGDFSRSSSVPPAPASSPKQFDDGWPPTGEKSPNERLPPSFGISLSLYMPSADSTENAGDEPDTARLLEEADEFVKCRKTQRPPKIKLFTANTEMIVSAKKSNDHLETDTMSNCSFQEDFNQRTSCERVWDSTVDKENYANGTADQSEQLKDTNIKGQKESDWNLMDVLESGKINAQNVKEPLEEDFETELESYLATSTSDTLPPRNGFNLEYLGPTRNDRGVKTHPIYKENQSKGKAEAVSERAMQAGKHHAGGGRMAVQICEEQNVTVDITPRNMGRKVVDKSLFKKTLLGQHREVSGRVAWNASDKNAHLPGQRSESDTALEVMATKVQNSTFGNARAGTLAATATVFYDEGDDESNRVNSVQPSGKTKKYRQRSARERDPVTMVSEMSTDDKDDFDKEADGDVSVDTSKIPQVVSKSSDEKNYYEIGRKLSKTGMEGKDQVEEFVTMTTKTILFDAEQPGESVVKSLVHAPLLKKREKISEHLNVSRPKSAARVNSSKTVTEVHTASSCGEQSGSQIKITDRDQGLEPQDAEDGRPGSRLGFVAVEADPGAQGLEVNELEDAKREKVLNRPPSGKAKTCIKKSVNKHMEDKQNKLSCQTSKDGRELRQRPLSASPDIRCVQSADVRRANEAARALRKEQEETRQQQTSSASRFLETRGQYAAYSSSRSPARKKNSHPASGVDHQIFLHSKVRDEKFDTEAMTECREMQDRLACYGIDVKIETLERALFPPSGKTLHYEINAKLPLSNTDGLLSHPRYWLPEEHKRLRLAKKKLALAELSLWHQKKAEERKAKLAAQKESVKKGKSKKKGGQKKLKRSQSIC